MLLAQGGRFSGWSLYVSNGRPAYAHNWLGRELYRVAGTEPLPPGPVTIRYDFSYDGGGRGKGGLGALFVNGRKVGEGRIDLDRLMDRLGQMGVTSILIEGGGRTLGSAFRAGIVDKVFFFYAPLISAGDDGVPICSGAGAETMRGCIRLERIRTRRFGDDVLIEGYVKRTGD